MILLLLLLLRWTRKSKMDFYSSSSWVFFFLGETKTYVYPRRYKKLPASEREAKEKSIKLFFCHFFCSFCLFAHVWEMTFSLFLFLFHIQLQQLQCSYDFGSKKREELCILIVDICSKIKNKQFSKLHWKNQVDDAQYAIFGNKFSRFLCNVTFLIDFMKFIYFLLFTSSSFNKLTVFMTPWDKMSSVIGIFHWYFKWFYASFNVMNKEFYN